MNRTAYYEWEGDACRIHTTRKGQLTADIYRAGRGIVPVAVVDVEWDGFRVSEPAYMRLIALDDALKNKAEN